MPCIPGTEGRGVAGGSGECERELAVGDTGNGQVGLYTPGEDTGP